MFKRLLPLLLTISLVACAFGERSVGDEGKASLGIQQPLLNPSNGGRMVSIKDLRPGDIVLSAVKGMTSVGVRIGTLSQVSHASMVIQGNQIVEAVGSGVRTRSIADLLDEESFVVAFRHPKVTPDNVEQMESYALKQVGKPYNYSGIMLQAPFSIERRVCELPVVPSLVRDFCIRGVAAIQLGWDNNDKFFCSQLVLQAYQQAGVPLTDANPKLVSPGDILHMREGDVPSIRTQQSLVYVGHLKVPPAFIQAMK